MEEQEVLQYTAVVGPTQILSLMVWLLKRMWVDEESGWLPAACEATSLLREEGFQSHPFIQDVQPTLCMGR